MNREQHIPLFLWVATAILAHVAWGGGADRAVKLMEQQLDVGQFVGRVDQYFGGGSGDNEVEISLIEMPAPSPEPPKPEDEAEDTDAKAEAIEPDDTVAERKPKPATPENEPEPTPPPAPSVALPEPPKPPKPEEKKPEEAIPENTEPLPDPKNRVAVQQAQEEDDPEDNPDAEHIAEKARKVAEETQARITATDQNDPEPNPAGNHSSSADNPGNADQTDIKHSDDSAGEMAQAPNDKATTPKPGEEHSQARAAGSGKDDFVKQRTADEEQVSGKQQGVEGSTSKARAAQEAQEKTPGQKASQAAPDLYTNPDGQDAVLPGSQEKVAKKARKARKKRLPPPKSKQRLLGFGAGGLTEGGVNLNIQQDMAKDMLGRGELAELRRLDGERRRSKHRGSWSSVGLERWRAAIENYVAKVQPGNQTALNTARVPFARYLNEIHNRLHPIFADSFLPSLSRLPADHPMNRGDLRTNLEIVVSRTDGRLVDMGVTRSSGVTAFDVAALESVKRAQPFGPPPSSIVSPDGNVYLHWEFYRDHNYACSTYFARPFILKATPETKPPKIPTPSFGPREESPGKQGRLDPAKTKNEEKKN